MFTQNYINALFNRLTGSVGNGGYSTANGKVSPRTVKLVSGESAQIFEHIYDLNSSIGDARCQEITTANMDWSDGVNYYRGLYFGSGTTPASKEDYMLEKPITTGLSFTSGRDKIAMDNGKYESVARHIVFNTSQDEISISEIGCFALAKYSSSTATTAKTYGLVLIERTVLPEPIIIAPNEAKTVTYKIEFDYSFL